MKLIDTHCHLTFDPLAKELDGVLLRAAAKGVSRVIVPAYDLTSWDEIEKIGKLDSVLPAYGLHPWVADQEIDAAELENRLNRTNAVALGEVGLDFKIEAPSRDRQVEVLLLQLAVAHKLKLPVLLHCRGAFRELLDILGSFKEPLRGVLHAYSRGPELMKRFLNLGLHIAFGGAVTRQGAKQARRSATLVPKDRLLVETDAPSIGLDGVEPKEVEPRHIVDIAIALATLRKCELDEIARSTTLNAKELFKLD